MDQALFERVLLPDYRDALLSPEALEDVNCLVSAYPDFARRAFTHDEWQRAYCMLRDVSDRTRSVSEDTCTLRRLPTCAVMERLLGEEAAHRYAALLEELEDNGSRDKPQITEAGWTRAGCAGALAALAKATTPHRSPVKRPTGSSSSAPAPPSAKPKTSASTVDLDPQIAVKRSGLWLPSMRDIEAWSSRNPELVTVAEEATQRLRLTKKLLQYVPRRKCTATWIANAPLNIRRLREYLRSGELGPASPPTLP